MTFIGVQIDGIRTQRKFAKFYFYSYILQVGWVRADTKGDYLT